MASRGKRILIGCALGCGTLVVLVIALVVGLSWWLGSPGELLEPQQLLGSETTGYVEWTLHLDDPGTEGFARKLIGTIQGISTEQADEMPEWLRSWVVARQHKQAEEDILKMFPMAAAWTLQPGQTADADLHLVSLSVERLGHQLIFGDWILGLVLGRGNEVQVDRYRGEKIYRVPIRSDTALTVFLRDGNLFVTSDLGSASEAVDRLIEAGRTGSGDSALGRIFAETQGRPLRGALTNGRGEVQRLWQRLSDVQASDSDGELWREVRGIGLSGGLRDDGSFAGALQVYGPDAEWATNRREGLNRALRAIPFLGELQMETEARAVADRVEIDFRLADLTSALARLGDALEFRRGSRRVRIEP